MPKKDAIQTRCYRGHDQSIERYTSPDGERWYCRACNRIAKAKFKGAHPHRERDRKRKLRKTVLAAYGNECECCHEREFAFLSLDHINGEVREGKRRKADSLCAWLRANNYPEGYRVLCHNCNQAIGYYGTCPHQQKRTP